MLTTQMDFGKVDYAAEVSIDILDSVPRGLVTIGFHRNCCRAQGCYYFGCTRTQKSVECDLEFSLVAPVCLKFRHLVFKQ